jgi:hypothetical protein
MSRAHYYYNIAARGIPVHAGVEKDPWNLIRIIPA